MTWWQSTNSSVRVTSWRYLGCIRELWSEPWHLVLISGCETGPWWYADGWCWRGKIGAAGHRLCPVFHGILFQATHIFLSSLCFGPKLMDAWSQLESAESQVGKFDRPAMSSKEQITQKLAKEAVKLQCLATLRALPSNSAFRALWWVVGLCWLCRKRRRELFQFQWFFLMILILIWQTSLCMDIGHCMFARRGSVGNSNGSCLRIHGFNLCRNDVDWCWGNCCAALRTKLARLAGLDSAGVPVVQSLQSEHNWRCVMRHGINVDLG